MKINSIKMKNLFYNWIINYLEIGILCSDSEDIKMAEIKKLIHLEEAE